jgi:hypothetical protein
LKALTAGQLPDFFKSLAAPNLSHKRVPLSQLPLIGSAIAAEIQAFYNSVGYGDYTPADIQYSVFRGQNGFVKRPLPLEYEVVRGISAEEQGLLFRRHVENLANGAEEFSSQDLPRTILEREFSGGRVVDSCWLVPFSRIHYLHTGDSKLATVQQLVLTYADSANLMKQHTMEIKTFPGILFALVGCVNQNGIPQNPLDSKAETAMPVSIDEVSNLGTDEWGKITYGYGFVSAGSPVAATAKISQMLLNAKGDWRNVVPVCSLGEDNYKNRMYFNLDKSAYHVRDSNNPFGDFKSFAYPVLKAQNG